MKTFIPKELIDVHVNSGFSVRSRSYFQVANELRDMAANNSGVNQPHFYVFPAIILYIAAFEAYVQEQLALSHVLHVSMIVKTRIDWLKARSGDIRKFKSWVSAVYQAYDRNGKGIDTNGDEYGNLIALATLRNMVIHYNPIASDHNKWPAELEGAVRRSKIKIINATWEHNLSTIEVSIWAHDTVRNAIQLFSRMTGAEDVFTCGEPMQWE